MKEENLQKKHIVSFSGGKDSSAMLLRMIELGMPIDRILFCDTGLEFPGLYKYVHRMNEYTKQTIGIEIEWLTPKQSFDDWFYGTVKRGKMEGQMRGWPLMFFPCYWSRESKYKLMEPICKGQERYIGFAADEVRRVESGRKKEGYNFPLADWGWTEKDALKYLVEKDFYEPFHLDFNRTGCFICPKQPMESVRTLCRKYPEQWKILLKYAKACPTFKPDCSYEDLKRIEAEELGCMI